MSPKESYRDRARERLLAFWERREEYGAPVGCVATTFTFSAAFFEEECLARFVRMDTDPREDGKLYLIEREEKLSEVFACVLVDRGHVDPKRSLRWHVLPVSVPDGLQHSKVCVLAWENFVRVLVGSANLTEHGYRRNFENVGVVEFAPKGGLPVGLLHDVLAFVDRVRALARGGGGEPTEGPRAALVAFVADLRRRTEGWDSPSWRGGEPRVAFLPVYPDAPSLFEQVRALWRGTGPSDAWVLSPFFDDDPARARDVADALFSVMAVRGRRTVHVLAPGNRQPDGLVELGVPAAWAEPWRAGREHKFYRVLETDEGGEVRALHAKSLWLARDDRALYLVGSSNFTGAGTGVGRRPVNVEANLAFVLPRARDPFARQCEEAYPPFEPVDPAAETVAFLARAAKETEDPQGPAPLPEAFEEALFRPDQTTGTLLLRIGRSTPEEFWVRGDETGVLLDSAGWSRRGSPPSLELRWPAVRPPSFLLVEWTDPEGDRRTSVWVVNVTDGSKLPPPEELRDLTLEELVAILSSARPLHEAMRRVLGKRRINGSWPPPPVDPHKKVDTSQYLLRRVRRVSDALEGLRLRLGRPAFTLDALRWRLRGPVGPLALARQLAEQEKEGAAFMIAEVALALHRVDWSEASGVLGSEVVHAELEEVLSELRALTEQYPPPKNLARYVADVFEVVLA